MSAANVETLRPARTMLTIAFSALHRELLDAARDAFLAPYDIRVLVALREGGGALRSDQLGSLLSDPTETLMRRSLGTLYARQLADGTGPDGGPRRAGLRSHVALTDAGRRIADRVIARATVRVGVA